MGSRLIVGFRAVSVTSESGRFATIIINKMRRGEGKKSVYVRSYPPMLVRLTRYRPAERSDSGVALERLVA